MIYEKDIISHKKEASQRILRIEGDVLSLKRSSIIFIVILILSSLPLVLVLLKLEDEQKITSNEDFFTLSIGDIPTINVSNWYLPINGEVENPVIYTYENLTSLPNIAVNATLQSVSGYSGRAEWRGVPLKDVLEVVRPTENAYDIIFYAADGYTSSLRLKEIEMSEILLVFEMNRETLPASQGFPLRVVAPGYYGYKWVKWVVRIEAVDYDYKGFWETRGWNDYAKISFERDWSVHAILFSISFMFGVASIMTGLRYSKTTDTFRDLPRFMNRRFHHFLSLSYVISAIIVFIYWIIQTFIDRGAFFYTLHGIVGGLSILLLLITAITGMKRYIRDPSYRGFHRGIYPWAVFFFSVSIVFGLLISVIFFY